MKTGDTGAMQGGDLQESGGPGWIAVDPLGTGQVEQMKQLT